MLNEQLRESISPHATSNIVFKCIFLSIGYYLLMNLSVRDILLAGLCIPFTLDSEIIAYTWNFGDIYCRIYR